MGKTVIGKLTLMILIFVPILTGACVSDTTSTQPLEYTMPRYEIVSFTLKGEGEHIFPIYLREDQTLHLAWLVKEGDRVWFHIITPSGKNLGFYENGQYANGSLSEGFCQGFTEGVTIFSPSEYRWGEGYYQMLVTSYSSSLSEVEVQYWIEETAASPEMDSETVSTSSSVTASTITGEPSLYDGKQVVLSGQTFSVNNAITLIVDGKSGIALAGDIGNLQDGRYRLSGTYQAETNTLYVTQSSRDETSYLGIEAGQTGDLAPVSVEGLIATPPKEVASTLSGYIGLPGIPEDIPVYAYVVYTTDGFYLALADKPVNLPTEVTFMYEGKDYSFSLSAGEARGILVRTPLERIEFGPMWEPEEFGGVVIASDIHELEPVDVTIEQVNAEPRSFAFKRVSINGSYLVTTAAIDYSEMKVPMGQGVLGSSFSDFFQDDGTKRLETVDPERKTWQLRECQVIGTVLYPTEQILRYLDYSAPLSASEVAQQVKPALLVDSLINDEVEVADISELNPVFGDPSQYWGKIVQFEGYTLGINYPLKTVVEAVTARDVPVNINFLAVGIADKPVVGSQLVIVGLNNDLIDEQGETIAGRYLFRVAVAQSPDELVGTPYAGTVFFLLSKQELPLETPG